MPYKLKENYRLYEHNFVRHIRKSTGEHCICPLCNRKALVFLGTKININTKKRYNMESIYLCHSIKNGLATHYISIKKFPEFKKYLGLVKF